NLCADDPDFHRGDSLGTTHFYYGLRRAVRRSAVWQCGGDGAFALCAAVRFRRLIRADDGGPARLFRDGAIGFFLCIVRASVASIPNTGQRYPFADWTRAAGALLRRF